MGTSSNSNPANSQNSSAVGFTLILFGVLFLAGAFYYFAQKAVDNRGNSLAPASRGGLAVGEPAPEIKAAGWVNGEIPADLTGKVIVLDAWATWCGPCKKEAPHLVKTRNNFADREDIIFIGLTTEGERSLPAINAFLEEEKITWVNGYGANETLHALKAEYIPSVWVINKQGKISWNYDSKEELADAILHALNE